MSSTFSTIHNMVQLPPIDARITPPPEELNIVPPKPGTCPALPESPKSIPDTHQSEVASASGFPARKKNQRRPSGSRSRPPRVDIRQQSQANSHLIFSPRPFENLYVERAYLASALQQQSARAADLIRQYSAVDLQLQSLQEGKGPRRRLRKQLGLLNSRINEAVEQEKAIFSRLGELYVEIQSREMWSQAHYQQTWSIDSPSVGSPSVYDAMSPSVYTAMSPMSYGLPTPTTPFNATSTEFVPMGYFVDFPQLSETSLCHQEPTGDMGYGLETVDEAGEELLCGPDSGFESVDSETTPPTPACSPVAEMEECGGMNMEEAFSDARIVPIRERRFSLPCLQNAWPEE
ncbi:hypothetical protein FALBO_13267 [Fusarium albosuccineum]|uniref:Uncharacterized protein n=1 Tax=Fusarium albosuccineum TaxID=1237068 RepID=A0A8H4KZ56_9HYPO|nr:hypothetical protein FALBO_13267 [Fusarium albosuccineum]